MSKFDERLKRSVVKQCESGKLAYPTVAKRNGVSASMVKLWVALHERHGAAGLRKKFDHYDAAFRLRALKQMWKHHWTYGETAMALDIHSSRCLAVWERWLEALVQEQKQQKATARKSDGYRRVTATLGQQGHQFNHKKVQRMMQELGLKSLDL